jgi:hypothetical protein
VTFRFRGLDTRSLYGVTLSALILAPRLLFALQMDQSFHQYLGWIITRKGLVAGLPYVGSFDQNFPGGAFIYALAIVLFGTSAFGFAIFDLIVQIITCTLIARLARKLDPSGVAALIAPIIYALTYIGLGVWDTGQRDCFVAPLLVLFATIVLSDRPRWHYAGLLLGAMLLIRPLIVLAGVPALWILFSGVRSGKAKDFAIFAAASCAFPTLVILLYLFSSHFTQLYEATIVFNLEVYSKYRAGVSYRGSGMMTYVYLAGLLGVLFRRRERKQIAFLLMLCMIAPLSTYIQGQGDAHHLVPTYAVAAVLAGLGFSHVISRVRWRLEFALFIIIIALGASRVPWHLLGAWWESHSLENVYALQTRGAMNLSDEIRAARYIQARTNSADHIQIYSMRIWPYVLSGREASSRFQSNEHLVMHPIDSLPLSSLQQRWRVEFMRDLALRPPRYVLITNDDHIWTMPHGEPSTIQRKRFPEFDAWVTANYAIDTTIGSYEIYRQVNRS